MSDFWLSQRSLTSLTARLTKTNTRYAVTDTLTVSELAPVAETRAVIVYVDSIDEAIARLALRVTEKGANVMLIEPEDEGVFEGSVVRGGICVVAVSQAARDLLTSPGRGPAEAEALITWMRENEEAWRASRTVRRTTSTVRRKGGRC